MKHRAKKALKAAVYFLSSLADFLNAEINLLTLLYYFQNFCNIFLLIRDTGIEDSFGSLYSDSLGGGCSSGIEIAKFGSSCFGSGKSSLKPSDFSSYSEDDSGFSGPPSPFSSTCGSYLTPGSQSCTPALGTPSSRNGEYF